MFEIKSDIILLLCTISILLCEGKRHPGFCPSHFIFHVVLHIEKILLVPSYYHIPIFASPVRINFRTSFCYHYVCGAHNDRKSQRALIFNLSRTAPHHSLRLPRRQAPHRRRRGAGHPHHRDPSNQSSLESH